MTGTPRTARKSAPGLRAFTIVEVLATLSLASIILPVAVRGVLLCLAAAGYARQQAQAASLAQSKLAEIVTAGDLNDAEISGDFGEEAPGYAWNAQVSEWEDSRLVQLDVSVTWARRGQQHHVSLNTLVYRGRADE